LVLQPRRHGFPLYLPAWPPIAWGATLSVGGAFNTSQRVRPQQLYSFIRSTPWNVTVWDYSTSAAVESSSCLQVRENKEFGRGLKLNN
jgi:hypothetical protein